MSTIKFLQKANDMPEIKLTLSVSDTQLEHFLVALANEPDVTGIQIPATAETVDKQTGEIVTPASEVDKRGIPWCEAVHATTKGVTKAGNWKRRKGVDEATCHRIEQEALAALNPPTAPAAPGGAPLAADDPGPVPASLQRTDAPVATMPTAPAAAMPGMPGATPPPPVSNTPAPPVTFDALIGFYQHLANSGAITTEQVQSIYQEAGVTDPNELATNETLRATLWDAFSRFGAPPA